MIYEQKLKQKIEKFYDVSSPYIFRLWGPHIHDGYYITGKESKQEAQENLIRLLVDKANISRGAKILDVGCGIGGTSIYLSKRLGAITTGITISSVQLKMAKKLANMHKVNPTFLLMDAEQIDKHLTECFDVIWMVSALTHLTNQKKFLKNATRFLKRKGKFILGDWMVAENVTNSEWNKYIKPVLRGMLMPNSYSISAYLQWFKQYGYQLKYAEDITFHTIKTWDVTLSIIKNPTIWKLAYKEGIEFINFLKSIRSIKSAMQDGKILYGVIIAEKL